MMRLLQSLTELVKKPNATLPSVTLLQNQLDFAANQEIPRDRLVEAYNTLTYVKVSVDKVRLVYFVFHLDLKFQKTPCFNFGWIRCVCVCFTLIRFRVGRLVI